MRCKMFYKSPGVTESVVRSYNSMEDAQIDVIDMLTFVILSSYVVQHKEVADMMYHTLQDRLIALFEHEYEDEVCDRHILDILYSSYNDLPFSSILALYLKSTIVEGSSGNLSLADGFVLQTSRRDCEFIVPDVGRYSFRIVDDPESDIRSTLKDLTRRYGSSKVQSILDEMEIEGVKNAISDSRASSGHF